MSPIAVIVVALVLLLLFIAALVFASRMIAKGKTDRRRAFIDAAAARGWTYEARNGGLAKAFGAKPFRKGVKRRPQALDVVSGMLHGCHAVGFRYRYTRGTNPDNLSDVYSWYTICAVQLPAELGSVDPARKTFTVDRGHEMVRQIMLARRRVTWCVDGNWLMCWDRRQNVGSDEVFARLELLVAIIDGRAGQIVVT